MRHHLAVLILILSGGACARTSMSSMPAPELAGRNFHHILVVAGLADLGLRQDMEQRIASHSSQGSYEFIPSFQVFFPGRQYSPDEVAAALREHQIDATLVVLPGDVGATSGYVPPTYTSGCTIWSSTQGCSQVTTTQTGGFTYQKPWAQFTASLYDVNTGRSIWVATATTGGNAYAGSTTLVRSMADKTAARLLEDGVVR
jgi:hypothetical protein